MIYSAREGNRQAGMPAAARAVNTSRTISMIASLTTLFFTFIGIDGMGHVNGHNVERNTFHQGKKKILFFFKFNLVIKKFGINGI